MLDVHPPEHPAHSWSDFFIHMGTICLGLLIALGLEQSVELLHRHHEVREAQHAIDEERAENRRGTEVNVASVIADAAILKNNLLVLVALRDHPGTAANQLPGVYIPDLVGWEPNTDVAWQAARQDMLLQYMPRTATSESANLYSQLAQVESGMEELFVCNNRADHFRYVDPDITLLTQAQVGEEIGLVENCLDADSRAAIWLTSLGVNFADFKGPTRQQLTEILAPIQPAANGEPAGPLALTKARTRSALELHKKMYY